MKRFWHKLLAFATPLLALYSVPLITMGFSREILPVDKLARTHAATSDANVVYGPAYTNPDKRYKLESMRLHNAPVVAVGTSRVMQFRSTFFDGGEHTFYNAGGLVSRIWHVRRVLAHLPPARTRFVILGLDQWSYNDNWEGAFDDPGVDAEYTAETDALANLRFGLQAWPDLVEGKISLRRLAFSTSSDLGVYARMKGNGFRRDGSYYYADQLRDPTAGADYEFRDTLARVRNERQRFQAGTTVSAQALEETRRLLDACRVRGLEVIAFLPPFSPTVSDVLRASPKHAYLQEVPARVREVVTAAGFPFFDFTDCREQGCVDAEFIDGMHGGDTLYARLLLEMASGVPWLAEHIDTNLAARAERARGHAATD
jgi:hypothetical protein